MDGAGIRRIRRIQTDRLAPGEVNGCASCFYFANRVGLANYFHFDEKLLKPLSEYQLRNFNLAKQEFEQGAESLTCTPLRMYMNFGFACNLACTMCHQVPRRGENRRQVLADTILSWHDALRSATDVTVIGGEPFTLPEAIKFIRAFVAHPDYESVPLTICTNGTVHHKHWNTVRQKRLMNFAISLDSIGAGYESIRVGSKWDVVERNVLMIQEAIKTDRPDWSLQTNGLILKTGVPHLPRFAEWHAKHGIVTSFYDFINSRGTEDAYFAENMLHNPQILDDMPDWERYFADAVSTFRGAGLDYAATSLDHYRERVAAARESQADKIVAARRTRMRNDWNVLSRYSIDDDNAAHVLAFSPGAHPEPHPVKLDQDPIIFTETRSGDHFTTHFMPIKASGPDARVRLRALWPSNSQTRRAHVVLQRENFVELDCFREFESTPFYYEAILTAKLPEDIQAIRVIVLPVGEDASALPQTFTLESDLETSRVEEAAAPSPEPSEIGELVSDVEVLPAPEILTAPDLQVVAKPTFWQRINRALPSAFRNRDRA